MLSAIVPALNAAHSLHDCLERLSSADELIVVDGGSSDATRAIARSGGARLVDAPRGRGSQLRAGVAAASGDWLLIVHADTLLEPGWRTHVDRHIRIAPGKAAYFRFRLRSAEMRARLLERLVFLRCGLFQLPYGDQGLLVSRQLYDGVGGYAAIPLMEDVHLVRRIGRGRLSALEAGALTSADKWQRDGWIARSLRNLACLLLFRMGMSPERIVRLYR